jgi:hypothetical protein
MQGATMKINQHRAVKAMRVMGAAALSLAGLGLFGCGGAPSASSVEGLSRDGEAANVAVLVQGNLTEAGNDVRLLGSVLADETAAYNFDIDPVYQATSATALAAIGDGARRVGPNGTLFLFLGGHGSPDGGSQMNDGRLVYYRAIRQQLAANISSPLKRLVLVVFGCYSGSWIDNIGASGDRPSNSQQWSEQSLRQAEAELGDLQSAELYEELVVMTSSSSGQLSYFTPGGNSHFIDAFARTFTSLKQTAASATIGDLLRGTQASVRSSAVPFSVVPAAVADETLFNGT